MPVKCSVILPVYNASRYLREAIQSILDQTFHNFELIVIDDGSNDSSSSIIDSFTDQRIVRVSHSSNQGLVAALNSGLAIAKGEYVFRMDADDVAYKDRLAIQNAYMDKNPNVVICGSGADIINRDGILVRKHKALQRSYTSKDIKSLMFFSCPFIHPTICIRNEALLRNNIHYDASLKQAEDYVLYTNLLKMGDFGMIDDSLLFYREHESDNRITNPLNRADIFEGRKVAWKNIIDSVSDESFFGDRFFSIHDKYCYYPNLLEEDEVENTLGYLKDLDRVVSKMCASNVFSKRLLKYLFSIRIYEILLYLKGKNEKIYTEVYAYYKAKISIFFRIKTVIRRCLKYA